MSETILSRMRKGLSLVAILALGWVPYAQAVYTITLTETGGNVVASGSGSLNTAGLVAGVPGNVLAFVQANSSSLVVGPNALTPVISYTAVAGPANFGAGIQLPANAGAGNMAGIDGNAIIVPNGYVSGAALAGTATWNATTFAGLGVTPGTHTWTWGADSLIVQIGPVAPTATNSIPTLSEWGMIILSSLLALGAIFTLRRQRH